MADGTIPFVDGLGFKALDSNELRRKQQTSVRSNSPQLPNSQKPNSTILLGMEGSSSQILPTPFKNPTSSLQSETGALNLNTIKTQSPSRKLQQAFFEEGLKLEAEERAARVHSHANQFTHQSTELGRMQQDSWLLVPLYTRKEGWIHDGGTDFLTAITCIYKVGCCYGSATLLSGQQAVVHSTTSNCP